jgi:Glycogen recognition site of AMP-activated protein kinase
LVVKTRDHDFPVRSLFKGIPRYWRAVLVGVLLFLGAGWHACGTVPRGPEREEVLVSFVFSGRHDSVCLSGDFNGWSSESHCLQRKGDEWSIQLALPPGSYRYGFVIDKWDWACDPDAPIQEDDGFGKKNSLLLIDPAVTKRLDAP